MMLFSGKASRLAVIVVVFIAVLTSCGKGEEQDSSLEAHRRTLASTGKFVPEKPFSYSGSAPAWGTSRAAWTHAVHRVVRARMNDLERARDVELFCPGYSAGTRAQKELCWVFIVAALSKYESAFRPETTFREPDGNYSVGLMALSPKECPNAPTLEALKNPVPNLICGTNRMALLIRLYGNIDGPAERRGASRYWSTLRKPYKYWDASRNKHLNLGKRDLIIPLVRSYKGGRFSGGGLGSIRDLPTDEADELPPISEEEFLENWVPRER